MTARVVNPIVMNVLPRHRPLSQPPRALLTLALVLPLAGIAVSGVGNRVALAAEATRVISGGEDSNPYDLNLFVDFRSSKRQAVLKREETTAAGVTRLARDLIYEQQRNYLDLRADLGVLPNLGLFFTLPLVLSDTRKLQFDQSTDNCPSADCVTADTSSLLRDGILPGAGMPTYGLNSATNQPFASPSSTVFAGPRRSGIEYLGAGLQWAVFDQARVASDPTWLLAFETRFSLENQKFDPADPKANTKVGPGYHQLVFSTAASRTFGRLEPFFLGSYMVPIKTGDSPFVPLGTGDDIFENPQQRGQLDVGIEATMWHDPRADSRLLFELRGHMEVRFRGLAQAELWEPLSGKSTCLANPADCRPGLDDGDTDGDGQPDPYPGVTRSPSYGIFGADAALTMLPGKHMRFRGLFGLTVEQDRFLTDGQSGYELFDAPGRRYVVERARSFRFLLEGAALF